MFGAVMACGCASFFGGVLRLRAGAGVCARRRSNFLLRRQEKVTKEKATLLAATPARSAGATCGGALAGCAVELAARLRRSAQTAAASQSTKACVLRHTPAPRPALLGTARREGDDTGHRCALPGKRRAPRGAERSDGPCRAIQPPGAAPGAGRLRGEHARRSAHACVD